MKKTLAMLAVIGFVAVPVFGEHLTGYVSDQQCATMGSKAAKASDWISPDKFQSCAQKCAKNGSPVIFVTEDNKVLKIDADSAQKANALLGHRVSVTGKVDNGTLKIEKISAIEFVAKTNPANHQEENMH